MSFYFSHIFLLSLIFFFFGNIEFDVACFRRHRYSISETVGREQHATGDAVFVHCFEFPSDPQRELPRGVVANARARVHLSSETLRQQTSVAKPFIVCLGPHSGIRYNVREVIEPSRGAIYALYAIPTAPRTRQMSAKFLL